MLPILSALVLQAAYGAVDLMVVGRFGSIPGLSAVSTGGQVLNLITFAVTQLATGVTVLIARFIGEKRQHNIGAIIGGSATLFAIIASVILIIMLVLATPIARLMQAPREALEKTTAYIRICGGGIFFIVAYNFLSAIFRGLGDSKSPLVFVLVACIVNIIGDLVLVAGLKMDAAGAAIATVFAQAVSVVFAVILLLKRKLPFEITARDFRINEHCIRAFKIGLPLAFQEMMAQLSFVALCAFVNRLGLQASSGYGVACKIVNFVMLIPGALMQSMASFVSQNIGAGFEKRAKTAMLTGIGVGIVVGGIISAFVILRGNLLTELFTVDMGVAKNGFAYLKGFALETVASSILFSIMGYLSGKGKTIWVMMLGLVQTFLVRVPFAYYMSVQPNASLTKIGLASPVSSLFGIVLCIIFFAYSARKEKGIYTTGQAKTL